MAKERPGVEPEESALIPAAQELPPFFDKKHGLPYRHRERDTAARGENRPAGGLRIPAALLSTAAELGGGPGAQPPTKHERRVKRQR